MTNQKMYKMIKLTTIKLEIMIQHVNRLNNRNKWIIKTFNNKKIKNLASLPISQLKSINKKNTNMKIKILNKIF
jgi:hypothetical protein